MGLDATSVICPSTLDDLPAIQQRYAEATVLQASKGMTQWPVIDEETILTEVNEGRQWKLLIRRDGVRVVRGLRGPADRGRTRQRPRCLPSPHCHSACSPWTRLGKPHCRLGKEGVQA